MRQNWSETTHASPADHAICRTLLRDGSRSFFAASLFLPPRARDAATSLYGFCRLADDAVDLGDDSVAALADLRVRLDRIYAGDPAPISADRAFADVVGLFGIPRALPEALLEGLAWDAEGRRYATLEELQDYAARVAGTVGVMMALLMGVRSPQALARACDLGIAMQLTNIARDVGEDARNGRVYLPLAWLGENGIDADALIARPQHSMALGEVIERLLEEAELLYGRAEAGIVVLPARCRPGIRAARWLYAEIGEEVERRSFNAIDGRAVVSGRRKLALLPRVLWRGAAEPAQLEEPPLDAVRFLIDAVAARAPGRYGTTEGHLADRVGALVDIFHRVEFRRQNAASERTRTEPSRRS